ncbi:calcium-binding protein [Ciceribacter sp. L1K22]|uniref:calcium-binding protein n=1 Tax=Ciceribacter sp. L1K22 TaxID=2820275 RepID=UPI001ABE9753|nr:calcium-binding protein [Ciceribacter sp. L1K22]
MADRTFSGVTVEDSYAAFIDSGDNVTVAAGALLAGTGFIGTGLTLLSNSEADIYGTVFGTFQSIAVSGNPSAAGNIVVRIHRNGAVTSENDGFYVYSSGASIDNAGTISGGFGIGVSASGLGPSTIVNSGSIIGHGPDTYDAGILQMGTERLVVTNTGLIKAAVSSFNGLLGGAVSEITNSGLMVGQVLLGGGADLYDGRLGFVDGIVYGGDGNDTLRGGLGDETLNGEEDDDTLEGNGGADTLIGGNGNDSLDGGSGDDLLQGDAGNDTLDGGTGADTMEGGTGDDTYHVDDAGDVVSEDDGAGTDIVRAAISYVLTANVENLTLTGSGNISGTGNDLDNTIIANAGDNTLSGGGGDDDLYGADGSDIIDGGTGADMMDGGTGDDTYYVDNAGDTVVEGSGAGTDTVRATISYTLADNVEKLILAGTSGLSGTGNGLANTLTGNAGNNTLDGGAGADRMEGGAGNDTYVVDNSGDTVVEGSSAGTDTVRASVSHTLATNVENLILTGSGNIAGTGNSAANAMTGNAGNNTLKGLSGNDTLKGEGGNDYLTGGAGADKLYGGSGADRFIFTATADSTVSSSGRDMIYDFSHGQGDRIDLSAIDASTKSSGNQAFSFIGEKAYSGKAGELRYVNSGGDTYVYADVNGDKASDFAIRIDANIDLVKGDFIL